MKSFVLSQRPDMREQEGMAIFQQIVEAPYFTDIGQALQPVAAAVKYRCAEDAPNVLVFLACGNGVQEIRIMRMLIDNGVGFTAVIMFDVQTDDNVLPTTMKHIPAGVIMTTCSSYTQLRRQLIGHVMKGAHVVVHGHNPWFGFQSLEAFSEFTAFVRYMANLATNERTSSTMLTSKLVDPPQFRSCIDIEQGRCSIYGMVPPSGWKASVPPPKPECGVACLLWQTWEQFPKTWKRHFDLSQAGA